MLPEKLHWLTHHQAYILAHSYDKLGPVWSSISKAIESSSPVLLTAMVISMTTGIYEVQLDFRTILLKLLVSWKLYSTFVLSTGPHVHISFHLQLMLGQQALELSQDLQHNNNQVLQESSPFRGTTNHQ